MDENSRMAEIYDRFSEYVKTTMRDRTNPNMSLVEFADMPRASVTHMALALENVTKGQGKMYDQVAKFCPGARLEAPEDIKTGLPRYIAYIPYKKERRGYGGGGDDDRTGYYEGNGPSMRRPQAILFAFMLLIMLAMWKTTWAQWYSLMK